MNFLISLSDEMNLLLISDELIEHFCPNKPFRYFVEHCQSILLLIWQTLQNHLHIEVINVESGTSGIKAGSFFGWK
jgi:hypothetical protein